MGCWRSSFMRYTLTIVRSPLTSLPAQTACGSNRTERGSRSTADTTCHKRDIQEDDEFRRTHEVHSLLLFLSPVFFCVRLLAIIDKACLFGRSVGSVVSLCSPPVLCMRSRGGINATLVAQLYRTKGGPLHSGRMLRHVGTRPRCWAGEYVPIYSKSFAGVGLNPGSDSARRPCRS